jgi:hypothetical protein
MYSMNKTNQNSKEIQVSKKNQETIRKNKGKNKKMKMKIAIETIVMRLIVTLVKLKAMLWTIQK